MTPFVKMATQLRASLAKTDFSGIAALLEHRRELMPPN